MSKWNEMSDAELYSSFTQAKWNRLSLEERLEAAQEVENRQAALCGRPSIPVNQVSFPDKRVLGAYSPPLKKIRLSSAFFMTHLLKSNFTPARLLETILHEGRHAYQHHLAKDPSTDALASEMLKTWKINCAEGGYISPGMNFYLYFQQAIERDARMFALQEMKRIRTMIEPDKQFDAILVQTHLAEYRYIAEALQIFPTLESLDEFEKEFLTRVSENVYKGLKIDPRAFHFFAETRAILEMAYHGGMKLQAIFEELQKSFLSNDYDLTVKVYDKLLKEHPEQYDVLQKRKLEVMERNHRWKELLEGTKPLASVGETLEKQNMKPSYRIKV